MPEVEQPTVCTIFAGQPRQRQAGTHSPRDVSGIGRQADSPCEVRVWPGLCVYVPGSAADPATPVPALGRVAHRAWEDDGASKAQRITLMPCISQRRSYCCRRTKAAQVTKRPGSRGGGHELGRLNLAGAATPFGFRLRVIGSLGLMGMDALVCTCGKTGSDERTTGSAGFDQPPMTLCPKGPVHGLRGRKRGYLAGLNAVLLPRT